MKQLLLALVVTFAFGSAFAQSAEPMVADQTETPVQQPTAVAPTGTPVVKKAPAVSPGVIAAVAGGLVVVAVAAGGGSSSKKDKPSSP